MEFSGRIAPILAVPLLLALLVTYHATAEVVDIQVEDKSAGFDLSGGPGEGTPAVLFLVYTDRGVFNIGWEPFFLEFRAAERYHALKKGKRYRVLVAGWRIPATNWYPRIVRIVE